MDYMEMVKVYGPLAVFLPISIYLMWFILKNYKADIESRLKMAQSLDRLSDIIMGRLR